ncbi:VOC family protein [Nocardia sp. NPDC058497]|uniref:VOC family protein n=1 Tax=Nocardia sp. NPDC058497 TaxID=3346529 RepID=UPI003661D25E
MTYTARLGDPVWLDLYTADPDRSIAFYGDLFGWTAERGGPEYGGYITFRKDGKAVAGGMGRMGDPDPLPDRWTVYLSTPDAAATTEKAKAKGARVLVEPMVVGDLGSMAVLADLGGASVGIWQPGTFGGFETRGAVFYGKWTDHVDVPSWFELMARDFEGSLDFYREVFGWDELFAFEERDDFRYWTLHPTHPHTAGVMDGIDHLHEGVPDAWTVYFGCADLDNTVTQALRLGGSIVFEPMDTPYGRVAALADSTGAHFSLGQNLPEPTT